MVTLVVYLVGGGNGTHYSDKRLSQLFCKEVTILDRSVGNHKNKVWIRSDKGESLIRKKVLAHSLDEAFDMLSVKLNTSAPRDNIKFLIEHALKHYPHRLI